MAKPDCDDGWLRYAHELDAALAAADFTKGARVVLHEVFAQVFGPAKLRSATLSPADIGRRIDLAREQISRAVAELVRADVLARLDDGTYRFNKDYESWRRDGKPRLTPSEVTYCRHAPARAMAYRGGGISTPTRDQIVTDPVTESSRTVTESSRSGVTESSRHRDGLVTESVTESSRISSPPKNPLLGGRIKTNETKTPAVVHKPISPKHAMCVSLARELIGDKAAALVASKGHDILESVRGVGAPTDDAKFDRYAEGIRGVVRTMERGETVRNPHTLALKIANDKAARPAPPPVIPHELVYPIHVAPPDSDCRPEIRGPALAALAERRAREARGARA